jgi:uncharacterized protein (DUF58 family)
VPRRTLAGFAPAAPMAIPPALLQACPVLARFLRRLRGLPLLNRLRAVALRVGGWGRAALDKFPFTLLGSLLVVAGFLAVRELGQRRQDVVLYVAGLGALAVALVAALLVLASAVVVAASLRPRSLPATRVEAGRIEQTGFSLPGLGWLPLIQLSWSWREPRSVRVEARPVGGRLAEEVVFGERGEYPRVVRRLVVEDALGLARVAFHFTEEGRRTVVPALGRPLSSPLLEAFAGGDAISHPAGPPDGDPIDMRRYALGDPMKRILWKVYARNRTLMVRLPERAVSPTHRTLAYLAAGPGDEAAAAVARMAVESGALGPEWRFSADLPEGIAASDESDAVRALALIVASRDARDRGGRGLGAFLGRNEAWGGRCVLFASAREGAWTEAVLEEIRRRPGRIEVVLGVDGVRDGERAGRWKRLFLLDEPADPGGTKVASRALEALGRRLASAGATVTLVDRPTGKVYARSGRRRRAA